MDEGQLVGGNTTVSSSLAEAKRVKDSPIGNASNQLQKANAVLNDELMMLADAIRPILTPVDQAGDNEKNPEPPRSDLAEMISREATRTFAMASYVRGLRERVEL